jgi:hypothetical protein
MSTATLSLVGDVGRLLAWRSINEDQLDNTCGAYWARAAVECLSDQRWPDEEEAALAAATSVLLDDPEPQRWLPWQGARGNAPRNHYRLALAGAISEDTAGTSARGAVAAIDQLSQQALGVVGVQHAMWSSDVVTSLIRALSTMTVPVVAICNVATKYFDGSQRALADVVGELTHGRASIDAASDWDVGHFCGLAGLIEGDGGAWVGLVDTYRTIGWNGLAVQRPAALAAALHRGGSGTGGVLIVAGTDDLVKVRSTVLIDGIVESMWSNGSSEP